MSERTLDGFAELVALKFSLPTLLFISLVLFNWHFSWSLGFLLGGAGGLLGSYFTWVHWQKLSEKFENKSESQFHQSAWGGTLASVALMAVVLFVSATSPWLDLFAAAAGLFVTKIFIGLTPFLRRTHGSHRS